MLWEFPEAISLPLDDWIDAFVEWLTTAGEPFFGFIGDNLLWLLSRLENFLLWLPWVVVIAVIAYIAYKAAGVRFGIGVIFGLVLVGSLGLWDAAMQTLALVIAATILATIIGIPVGISMAKSAMAERIIKPLLDLMQTMPSFVYLIPTLMLFGIGRVSALIATLVYALPPIIRLTNLGIRQVAEDVIEAAQAFGTSSGKLLVWVQVPLALPTILAGLNQTIMMAVAMVVIASMIGAGGLGSEVLRGIARLEVGTGFNAGISIVALAIIIDRITQGIANRRRPTPLP